MRRKYEEEIAANLERAEASVQAAKPLAEGGLRFCGIAGLLRRVLRSDGRVVVRGVGVQ